MKLKGLIVTLDVSAGSSIDVVSEAAALLMREGARSVDFHFNGTHVVLRSEARDFAKEAREQYWAKREPGHD